MNSTPRCSDMYFPEYIFFNNKTFETLGGSNNKNNMARDCLIKYSIWTKVLGRTSYCPFMLLPPRRAPDDVTSAGASCKLVSIQLVTHITISVTLHWCHGCFFYCHFNDRSVWKLRDSHREMLQTDEPFNKNLFDDFSFFTSTIVEV